MSPHTGGADWQSRLGALLPPVAVLCGFLLICYGLSRELSLVAALPLAGSETVARFLSPPLQRLAGWAALAALCRGPASLLLSLLVPAA